MLLEEIGSGRSDCGWKAARAEASLTAQIQMALDAWVSERATSEKMTGAAAYISFGEPGPAIEVFAEKWVPVHRILRCARTHFSRESENHASN
jgi:hypothetical protein